MLRTIPDEGLSRPAKALLKLLKWAEEVKKELPKREPKTTQGVNHERHYKDNTTRCERESSRTAKQPACTKAGS